MQFQRFIWWSIEKEITLLRDRDGLYSNRYDLYKSNSPPHFSLKGFNSSSRSILNLEGNIIHEAHNGLHICLNHLLELKVLLLQEIFPDTIKPTAITIIINVTNQGFWLWKDLNSAVLVDCFHRIFTKFFLISIINDPPESHRLNSTACERVGEVVNIKALRIRKRDKWDKIHGSIIMHKLTISDDCLPRSHKPIDDTKPVLHGSSQGAYQENNRHRHRHRH